MIVDSMSRLEQYEKILPHLSEGMSCLQKHIHETEAATYQFMGGYLMIQSGMTCALDDGYFEAHKKYLDVQVLLEGSETVVWADIAELHGVESYNIAKDKMLYCGAGSIVVVRPGMCYVCFPHDAHKACRHLESQTSYRKAVIKLELLQPTDK